VRAAGRRVSELDGEDCDDAALESAPAALLKFSSAPAMAPAALRTGAAVVAARPAPKLYSVTA
jgi:hypothetical protein